jgi:hypothetical protein
LACNDAITAGICGWRNGVQGQFAQQQSEPLMSALGQKRTWDCRSLMSALPPKADIAGRQLDVRFMPIADIALLRSIIWPAAAARKVEQTAQAASTVFEMRVLRQWWQLDLMPSSRAIHADNNLGSHQFIISCAQFGRDSLFCMTLGTVGWAAVIRLIRRNPDLRWLKADVEGESV